jgi:hypothetical protein
MKWMHALALGVALTFAASIQIAALSPAFAVEPDSKGSKSKPKKKPSSARQSPAAPQTTHDPTMDRKSPGSGY